MAFLVWLRELIPHDLHLFPHHWTMRQKKAGRLGLGLLIAMTCAMWIWGIGVMIGWGLSWMLGVMFLAWEEDEQGKFED